MRSGLSRRARGGLAERADTGGVADPADVLAAVAGHLGDVALLPAVVADGYDDRLVQLFAGLFQPLLGAAHSAHGRDEVTRRHAYIVARRSKQSRHLIKQGHIHVTYTSP